MSQSLKISNPSPLPPPADAFQSPKEKRFRAIADLCPEMLDFLPHPIDPKNPPPALCDQIFASICMCFADPIKRQVLLTLILDLLADDLRDTIIEMVKEAKK